MFATLLLAVPAALTMGTVVHSVITTALNARDHARATNTMARATEAAISLVDGRAAEALGAGIVDDLIDRAERSRHPAHGAFVQSALPRTDGSAVDVLLTGAEERAIVAACEAGEQAAAEALISRVVIDQRRRTRLVSLGTAA